jgi:hypothetical protein
MDRYRTDTAMTNVTGPRLEAVDPVKILVIAVGIEQYEYGSDMDLPGAGAAAARFAHWAINQGVPSKQVWLACNFLPESAPQFLPNCKKLGTTEEKLQDMFRDASRNDADVLLFYWIGHGVLNEKNERALFLSNANDYQARNFTVDNLIRSLDSVGVKGLHRQFFIIDACANFVEELNLHHGVPPGTLPEGNNRRGSFQSQFYSASQGEIAAYNREERRSPFSETVLAWFETQGTHALSPRADDLYNHILTKFEDLRDAGDVTQRPAFTLLHDGSGREEKVRLAGGMPVSARTLKNLTSINMTAAQVRRIANAIEAMEPLSRSVAKEKLIAALGGSPDEAEFRALPMQDLTARALAGDKLGTLFDSAQESLDKPGQTWDPITINSVWNRQKRICQTMNLFTKVSRMQVEDAYCWALQTTLGDKSDIPADLDGALDRVEDHADVDGNRAAHRFVAYLRETTHEGPEDGWFGLGPASLSALRSQVRAALSEPTRLIIEVPNGSNSPAGFTWPEYIIGHWLMPGQDASPPQQIECFPRSCEGVKKAVNELLKDTEARSFTLGFMMPRAAFDEVPEAWAYGSDLVEETPLWHRRPTVLHSMDRRTNKDTAEIWSTKTKDIRSQLEQGNRKITWIDSQFRGNPERIRNIVRDGTSPCYGLAFAPGRFGGNPQKDPIIATLVRGAPFIIWFEEEPDDGAKTELEKLISEGPFREVPKRLHRLRENDQHKLRDRVRLIWDDPDELPPIPQLAGMKEGS